MKIFIELLYRYRKLIALDALRWYNVVYSKVTKSIKKVMLRSIRKQVLAVWIYSNRTTGGLCHGTSS